MQVPLPLVSLNVLPELEQEPALEKLTPPPGAVAATAKLVLYAAFAGAWVVTAIVWLAFCALAVSLACAAL